MKTFQIFKFPLLLIMCLSITSAFQSCDPDDDDECEGCDMLYKPNIYIYPTEQVNLTVTLGFPLGGEVVESIPEYGTGWNVNVDTTGLIDEIYSFLFYESEQPSVWQMQSGWVIKQADLESFFRNNLSDYGFAGREIEDYIEYWIPRFNDHKYYSIYPQTKGLIDGVVTIDISIKPDHLLRLFYVIKGEESLNDQLPEPSIEEFNRDGYFVTEWGVVLK